MRIAFVSQLNTKDVHAWSGTPFFMVQALRASGHQVVEIGPLNVPLAFVIRLVRKAHSILTGKFYDINRNPLIAASFARQVSRQINKQKFDLILSPSSIPCTYLKTDIPTVFWTDATFAGMVDYYPGDFSRMSRLAIKHSNALEQRAIQTAALCLYTSDWAAESAMQNYRASTSKVKVVCFGANLNKVPNALEVESAINTRQTDICHLLFIGVDWKRKGGDLVIQTAIELNSRGLKVVVDIVGCDPVGDVPDYVNCHGFISKSTEEGERRMHEIFLTSHYLFLPSNADCTPMVYAEASAYGVPSIARATGGVSTVVRNGVNGFAFPVDADHHDYAEYIYKEFLDTNAYRAAAIRAREFYESTLNWDSSISMFEKTIIN